ncbi:tRNA-intron endonuclease [Coprinopsis cinerea AmutBmut pab1-1]|nr:tRNA-intron endonuclease [Coprinopsis cinerea AmutBmut pab1-1]
MSLVAPNPQGKRSRKGGARNHENNRIYAHPLPLLFVDSPAGPVKSVLGLLGLSLTRIENPHCEGIFDPITRSVWVSNMEDSMVLWRRGFFGKGNLSRSEPSWLSRQLNIRKAAQGKQLTSEEITARRRAERKQFKLDRARAIAAVAQEAEEIFEKEGRAIAPALSGPAIPSAATWKPSQPIEFPARAATPADSIDGADEGEEEEEELKNVEHLQITLQEAFFLLWNMDCLTVLDPNTLEPMSLKDIWIAFQRAHLPPSFDQPPPPLQFDNPFLINYAVYHHYRSLGWVVKGGIKFCVDYLLYKRGPVFSHAEFALVVMPVYEDEQGQASSMVNLQNSTPFTWSWLSTINRVNSQVQKTLVLVYVTIPSKSRISTNVLNSPACFKHYSIREVVLRRFIPARMRD